MFMQAGLYILAAADFLLQGYGGFAGRPKKICSLTREHYFPSEGTSVSPWVSRNLHEKKKQLRNLRNCFFSFYAFSL